MLFILSENPGDPDTPEKPLNIGSRYIVESPHAVEDVEDVVSAEEELGKIQYRSIVSESSMTTTKKRKRQEDISMMNMTIEDDEDDQTQGHPHAKPICAHNAVSRP